MIKSFVLTGMLCISCQLAAQSTYNLSVQFNKSYQTIESFGASDCWTADFVGKYFDEANKEQAAKWLFSTEQDADGNPLGIGLSGWRVNVGAGSAEQGDDSGIEDATRRAYCYLNSDGSYTWTKAAGQLYFMEKAKDYGVENFTLFSNSAPVYFTKNGKAYADANITGSNLKDDCFDDFADFLTTVAGHFVDQGYNITYLDPVNEPQYDWTSGQEGSPWTNENIATLVRNIDTSINSKSLSTRILLPEAGSWTYLYGGDGHASNQIEAFFNPVNEDTYIGDLTSVEKSVAGHSYWTFTTNDLIETTRKNVAEKAAEYNLGTMQTEWSMLDEAPESSTGFPSSYESAEYMDISLFMAKLIYSDLVFANVTSWNYWTAMAQEKWGQKNRFYLLRLNAEGDTDEESYGDLANGGTVTDNTNLWALGNYSYFIRPGYQRVELTGTDSINGLLGSAFLSGDRTRLVLVLVNMKQTATGYKLDLGDYNFSVSSIVKYVTDSSYNLHHDTSLSSVFSSDNRMVLSKRSVNTFVIDFSSPLSGIESPKVYSESNNAIYDLSGRKVSDGSSTDNLQNGIYIQNGHKIVLQNNR